MTKESLDKLSSIAFIGACVFLIGVTTLKMLSDGRPSSLLGGNPAAQEHNIRKGLTIRPITGVSFPASSLTVALVVQSQCHFCAASMPFYRELSQLRAPGRIQFAVFSHESVDTTTGYLQANDVRTDVVAQLKGQEIPTTGTPTLVLIDRDGIVRDSWIGQLSAAQEQSVKLMLSSTTASAFPATGAHPVSRWSALLPSF